MRKDKLNLYALRSDQFWIGMSAFLKGKHFFVTAYINIFIVGFLSILDFLKWIPKNLMVEALFEISHMILIMDLLFRPQKCSFELKPKKMIMKD